MRVALCVPFLHRPTDPFIEALEQSIVPVMEAGWDDVLIQEVGNPYICQARALMLRKAMDQKADVVVFLDYDLSWGKYDLLTLIHAEGDVVAGTYRFKANEEQYMGMLEGDDAGFPIARADGALKASRIPAGFMKISAQGVHDFMHAYPELLYGPRFAPHIDMFAMDIFDMGNSRVWHGEDYSFSRRWCDMGGDLWVLPSLKIDHHGYDRHGKHTVYAGDLHDYLCRAPGGSRHKPTSVTLYASPDIPSQEAAVAAA